MSNKQRRLDQLKNSDFFPERHIETYDKDYDRLADEEIDEVHEKINSLKKSGLDLEEVKNVLLSHINARVNITMI